MVKFTQICIIFKFWKLEFTFFQLSFQIISHVTPYANITMCYRIHEKKLMGIENTTSFAFINFYTVQLLEMPKYIIFFMGLKGRFSRGFKMDLSE